MKIETIPIGKENKISRGKLINILQINNIKELKKQLAELKQDYIILYDEGYYRPSKKEEYEEFILKCNGQKKDMEKLIELAKAEMERICKN